MLRGVVSAEASPGELTPALEPAAHASVEAAVAQLDREGFALLEAVLTPTNVEQILDTLPDLVHEAEMQGSWRSPRKLHVEDMRHDQGAIQQAWRSDRLVRLAEMVLGENCFVLGVRYRAPLPGHGQQTIHVDDPGWSGTEPRVLNVIIPLVDFGPRSGATRVVPRSHIEPPEIIPDDETTPVPGQVIVQCDAGDALCFGAGLWHSGTMNQDSGPRHSLAISYARADTGLARDHLSSLR